MSETGKSQTLNGGEQQVPEQIQSSEDVDREFEDTVTHDNNENTQINDTVNIEKSTDAAQEKTTGQPSTNKEVRSFEESRHSPTSDVRPLSRASSPQLLDSRQPHLVLNDGICVEKENMMKTSEGSVLTCESGKIDKSSLHKLEDEVIESELTTVFETFWNICNTIQGLPILAIPYTFKVGGWWSLITLLIIAVASNYTSIIIVRSLYEEKDGEKVRVRSSYMDIGEAFWPAGGKWLVLIVMVVELLFVATLYPVLVGAMFAKSFPAIKLPLFAWTVIGGLALLPNTLLKNLSQVAWTSIITVVSAKIIFISVIGYSVSKYHKWEIANLDNFEANAFPASVAILVSCYLAQPFVAFIESTMKRPEKFEKTLNWSFIAMTTLNVLIGLIAGVTFYPDTDEVITNNLPEGFFRQIVNAMAAILAFTSYTLPVFTAFDVIETSRSSCLAKNFGENIYSCKVQTLRLCMVIGTILMAAAIPHYTYLLAVVGSMTGITLEFIFPALFHMKIYCMKLRWYEFAIDIIVVFIGTLVMTISLIVSWLSMYKCFLNHEC